MERFTGSKEREQFVSRRMVVKIGSRRITEGGDPLNREFMGNIAGQVSTLFKSGVEVIIVSSGAVVGGDALIKKRGIDLNQLCSSNLQGLTKEDQKVFLNRVKAIFGQVALVRAWEDVFARYGILAGQALYEDRNLENKGTKEVLEDACKIGVPIINGNDAVSDFEMRKLAISADNDKLAGHIAETVDADTLVLLTDVDGVLDENGESISFVDRLEDVQDLIRDTSGRPGGMRSKILIAKTAAREGRRALIANGNEKDVLIRIAQGQNLGTRFGKGWMLY